MPHPESRPLQNPHVPPVSHIKHPGNGFYKYVNQNWLKSSHIGSWRSEFGVSDEIEDLTNKELLKILDTLDFHTIKNVFPKTPKDQLSLLSHIWKHSSVENEESYIKLILNELMRSNESRATIFGWMCRSRISTIVTLVPQEEKTSPYLVRTSLTPGSLTLPLKYYLDSSHPEVWKAYTNYITICSVELGLPFLLYAIDGEKELAKHFDKSSIASKRLKGRSLVRWIPFLWTEFMNGLNIDDRWQNRTWLLDTPEILHAILNWTLGTEQSITAVFALHIITFAAPYLRPTIQDAANALFNKILGTSTMPLKHQFLNDMKHIAPEALCTIYAERQHDAAKVSSIQLIINQLKSAAVDIIDTTDLSKRTMSSTREKIHRMKFQIGKTNVRLVNAIYYPESLLHTIVSIQSARTSMIRTLTGKSSDTDSSYPCFQANASYYSESNRIIIPWGILQWPFYSSKLIAPLGWNYGGIGATIAHEMTHAFDLEGIHYSQRAIYKDLWTRKDRNTFRGRTRKLGKFFEKFKHYGIHLDGKKTLSEDWADFGGLTIALRGLKGLLEGRSEAEQKEAYKNFFIAYAVSWRTLINKDKMLYALMTSVHAPAEDRVDRIVPQFQEWVDAFDIREDDALYIPRGQRLTFF